MLISSQVKSLNDEIWKNFLFISCPIFFTILSILVPFFSVTSNNQYPFWNVVLFPQACERALLCAPSSGMLGHENHDQFHYIDVTEKIRKLYDAATFLASSESGMS